MLVLMLVVSDKERDNVRGDVMSHNKNFQLKLRLNT